MKKQAVQFKQKIKQARSLFILTHEEPDGDAIGSSLLLEELAKKINPKIKVTKLIDKKYKQPLEYFTQKYKFVYELPSSAPDLVIAVDASAISRLAPALSSKIDINIDHHIDNSKFGQLNIIDFKAAAAGQIVFTLCQALHITLNKKMAEGLYLAISSDTGNFSFANTNAEVFQAALAALGAGANPYQIYHLTAEQIPLGELQSLGRALATVETFFGGKLILGCIDKNSSLDNRVLIDFIRREKNASLAVVLVEKPEYIKLSLRSKDALDVSRIGKVFNGGGHQKAAAGKILTTELSKAKEILLKYLEKNVF